MKRSFWILAVAALLTIGQNVNGQITYQIDDGVSEALLGQGLNGDLLWGNYFDELPGGSTIASISVAIGDAGVPVGTTFQVAIYEDMDDDGSPATNLMFLASATAMATTPEPLGTDTLQSVDIPDSTVSGGFFVAAFMSGSIANPFPAKLDQTTTMQRSWFAEHNNIGGLVLTNPFGSATLSGLVDNFGFPGNWVLRAVSTEEKDCLLGDVNQDGIVSLADVNPFVNILTSGGFQCEADVNEDGNVTLADVNPFVVILTGG